MSCRAIWFVAAHADWWCFQTLEAKQSHDSKFKYDFIVWPDAPWKMWWDLFIIALVLYNAIVLPVDVAFQIVGSVWQVVDWGIDVLFIVDIVMSFRTARFDAEGRLVSDPRGIARMYV